MRSEGTSDAGSTIRLRARNLDVTSAAAARTIEQSAQGKIYVVVQGMYLLADSLAYDAAFQYRALRALGCDVEVFVERFDAGNYPDVPARPIRDLAPTICNEQLDSGTSGSEIALAALREPAIVNHESADGGNGTPAKRDRHR